jgi:agmatinase
MADKKEDKTRPRFEPFIGCEAEYPDSRIVLFGAPFDGTASYRPGARFGSDAVRRESYSIETYSPYLDRDLTDADVAVFDCGDLDLPFGSPERALEKIEAAVSDAL